MTNKAVETDGRLEAEAKLWDEIGYYGAFLEAVPFLDDLTLNAIDPKLRERIVRIQKALWDLQPEVDAICTRLEESEERYYESLGDDED
jgi:hypothetical protein